MLASAAPPSGVAPLWVLPVAAVVPLDVPELPDALPVLEPVAAPEPPLPLEPLPPPELEPLPPDPLEPLDPPPEDPEL